ncbi:MAG: DUF1846 family protein [Nanoarchaeota archaeon]|jgi:uncharacterized protein (UPF0371 family)|nr:DUF1846 family protein [Nanoarchaeota archaeon]
MLKKIGFDSKRYLNAQSTKIFQRLNLYDRLYIEFGGHLTYDGHASRVLPGYKPDNKIKLLKSLGEIDIIYCINAKDLQSKKHLGDFNLSYQEQTLKDIQDLKKSGLKVSFACITRYENEPQAKEFKKTLTSKGIKTYYHKEIKDYPNSINAVLKGYDNQPYIPIKKKITIITGAAGGSGKMATALCQVYKDRKKKIKAGYTKFETFPIWNLPLNHPINIAYEAATADLGDKNMIDPYHLKAYKIKAVNYNRDIENFAILKKIADKLFIKGNFPYKSPTDMGVNMAKEGIINEEICKKAAIKEIKRRMKVYTKEYKAGREPIETINRMKEILKKI